MGAGNSKPGASTQHVFASDTPVQFSQELIDSLQASSETNSTRAKSLELHIAQRVADELDKIQKHETDALNALRERLVQESSKETPDTSKDDPKDSSSSLKQKAASLLELPSISARDLIPRSTASKEDEARKKQSTQKVQAEIAKLQQQLGQRKHVNEVPKEVEKARESVIGCLRVNNRRPLDCWKEVEMFKREVRRMEEKFVGDVL